MRSFKSFADIIDAWEKPADFAADVGEDPGLVRQWRARDTLPSRVWAAAVAGAERRDIAGVTLDVLAAVAAAQARAA